MTALTAILTALAVLGATAIVTVLVHRSDRAALWVGTAGALVACAIGGTASVLALLAGRGNPPGALVLAHR